MNKFKKIKSKKESFAAFFFNFFSYDLDSRAFFMRDEPIVDPPTKAHKF